MANSFWMQVFKKLHTSNADFLNYFAGQGVGRET